MIEIQEVQKHTDPTEPESDPQDSFVTAQLTLAA